MNRRACIIFSSTLAGIALLVLLGVVLLVRRMPAPSVTGVHPLIAAVGLLPADGIITWVNDVSEGAAGQAYVTTVTKEKVNEYQVWFVEPGAKTAQLLASHVSEHPGTMVSLHKRAGVEVARTETEYRGYTAYEDFILSGQKVAETSYAKNGTMKIVVNSTTTTVELAPQGICDVIKPGNAQVQIRGVLINGQEHRFPKPRSEYCTNWPFFENALYDYQTIANPVFHVDTRWGDHVTIGDAMGASDLIRFDPSTR